MQAAWLVLFAVLVVSVALLVRPGWLLMGVLAVLTVVWLPVNRPVEGAVLLRLSGSRGVTVADLLVPALLLVLALSAARLRRREAAAMRRWARDNGLLLANLGLFAVFFLGLFITGQRQYNDDQRAHGEPRVSLVGYLSTPNFGEAVFENWESEFLQMGMYVVLTAYLIQKGSAESKSEGNGDPREDDPRDHASDTDAPWPVRRGGPVLVLYENSLALLFALLFALSIGLHARTGWADFNQSQLEHGQPTTSLWGYATSSRFWFESFQNWQSEFLAVATIVLGSVWLRQRSSSQSKAVHAPHSQTGD